MDEVQEESPKPKKSRRTLIIVIVLLVVCLVALAGVLGIRGLLVRLGGSTTINPVNTLIWLPAASPTPTGTPFPIPVTPNPSQVGATETATPTTTTTPQVPTAAPTTSPRPCDNVLYPLRAGEQWTYRASARGASYLLDMSVPSVSGPQALVNVTNQITKLNSQVAVECDNGAIRNFPWTTIAAVFNPVVTGGMSVQYVSGIVAPSQAAFTNSNWNLTWTGQYILTGTGTVRFQGNDYAVTMNQAPLQITCHTTGSGSAAFGSVTVAAGTFPSALKVLCSFQTQASLKINGLTLTGTVTGATSQWYAPGLGLLKLQADSANIEYFIFTVPLNVAGGLELVQYHPVP